MASLSSALQSMLPPEEDLVRQARLHAPRLFLRSALVVALAAVGYATAGALTALLLLGAAALLALVPAMRYASTSLAVTDRRLLATLTPGHRRDPMTLDLREVAGVDVRQSPLGRLLGYGTVTIRGEWEELGTLAPLADPRGFQRAVLEAAGLARDR